jgi:hypothetical protein
MGDATVDVDIGRRGVGDGTKVCPTRGAGSCEVRTSQIVDARRVECVVSPGS